MICPQCQHWIQPPSVACPNCGWDKNKPVPPSPQLAPPEPPLPLVDQWIAYVFSLPRVVWTWIRNLKIDKKTQKVWLTIFLGAAFTLVIIDLALSHPVLFIILAFVGLIVFSCLPQRCYICRNGLSNHVYRWRLDGQLRRVCSHCNKSLSSKNSHEAMKRRGQ